MSKKGSFKSEKAKILHSLCNWGVMFCVVLMWWAFWLFFSHKLIITLSSLILGFTGVICAIMCSIRNTTLEEKHPNNLERQVAERDMLGNMLVFLYVIQILNLIVILSVSILKP